MYPPFKSPPQFRVIPKRLKLGQTGFQNCKRHSHVSDNGNDFNQSKCKLGFTITFDANQINRDYGNQEYSDEDSVIMVMFRLPEVDCDRCRNNLQRKNSKPLHCIILRYLAVASGKEEVCTHPSHCKSPSRIQKPGRIRRK